MLNLAAIIQKQQCIFSKILKAKVRDASYTQLIIYIYKQTVGS